MICLAYIGIKWYYIIVSLCLGGMKMSKRIRTINTESLQKTAKTGGCGECQTSCQSACKTSCTVGNQVCKQK